MKTAKEYLKQISPNDQYGIREKLQSQNMRGHVEDIMERYANEVSKALLEEAAEKVTVPVNPYTLEPQDGLDDATIIHLEREYLKARKIQ